MSIQELREQIQEDIIAILDGENQDMINAICDIIVDRFDQFENNNDKTTNDAINLIKTLREDAVMALDGRWDRSDDGFEDQITLIDKFLN
jgi:hypothetical protein